MPNLGLALLFAAALGRAQPTCTVQVEERLSSVTARFLVGPTTAAITLPVGFRVEFLTFYLQVSNAEPGPSLFLESSGQKVAVRQDASFNLEPEIDRRPTFSITDNEGRALCAWQPSERVWAYDPPFIKTPASRLRRLMSNAIPSFFNAGDPIVLDTRSRTAHEFTIDGRPAAVLARTTRQVILSDPNPSTGFRTVDSDGFAKVLAMVKTEWQLSGSAIEIKVNGPEVLTAPAALMLFHLGSSKAVFHCGVAVHHTDWPQATRLPLHSDGTGGFTASCSIKLGAGDTPGFDMSVQEQMARPAPPFSPRLALPRPKLEPARPGAAFQEATHG